MNELQVSNLDQVRSWVAIEDGHGTVKVPLGNSYSNREGECVDVCLSRSIDLISGLVTEISIGAHGGVRWMTTLSKCDSDPAHANPYWHFSRGNPDKPATAAQRRVLAEMWLGKSLPFGLRGLGGPVCQWAFAGATPQSLAKEFDAACPALNGAKPCATEMEPVDRTPWQKGDDCP